MTDSLRTPWILNYLILVAEQYGGNLAAVPCTDRGHKSQVIKFLTFPPQGSTEPCVIWADVSDKQHFIHARISSDAIQTFLKDPRHAGASITSYKTALVSLKKFRPAFGRVARRERSGGMTDHARLYLDVDEIVVIGCHGQPTWGAPKDIAQDANIEEWMLGLQQHGGGGNVLKLRKERLLAQAAERADQLQADSLENLRQVTIDAMNVKVQVARKSVAHKTRPSTEAAEQRSAATREAVRRASWKRVHTNMMKYFRPPDDIFKQLLLLSGITEESTARPAIVHPPRHQLRSRSRSRSSSASYKNDEFDKTRYPRTPTPSFSARTPSQWSPSTQGSPRVNECSATEDEADYLFAEDDDDLVDDEELPAQSPCAPDVRVGDELRPPAEQGQEQEPPLSVPQPAQPRAPLSSMPSVPYATSPQRTPSPALGKSPKGPLRDIDALPPSSFPAPTYPLPPSPTSSPRPMPITPAPSAPALRRVPLPQYNPLRRDPDASGQGRVLVQNSDTTSPASQRHSQSQSQGEPCTISQSDESGGSQSQNQPPSQPQRPSQLRNEIGHPVSADDEQVATSAAVERQDEDMADSQEVRSQPQQPWSQQSLSYKGDSQSQEGAVQQPPADLPPDTQASASASLPNADCNMELSREQNTTTNEDAASGEREPSPMDVDLDRKAAGAAAATVAGWATMPSIENSEESQTEVDELLSDPVTAAIPEAKPRKKPRAKAPSRPPQKLASKTTAERSRDDGESLDPDDARTAEMVDGYKYHVKVRELIQARNRSHAGLVERADVPALPATAPTAPAAERTDKDHQPGRNRSPSPSQSSQPSHDPSIWTAPTFMRKAGAKGASKPDNPRVRPVAGVKVEEASPKELPKPQARKRVARPSSPSGREQSPAKKRKTSAGPMPVPVAVAATDPPSRKKQASLAPNAVPNRSSTSIVASTSKAPLLPQDPSPSSSRPSTRAQSAVPKPSSRLPTQSVGAGSSREPMYVDLRASSRSSSRTSRVSEGKRPRVTDDALPSPPRSRPNPTVSTSGRPKGTFESAPPAPPSGRSTSAASLAKRPADPPQATASSAGPSRAAIISASELRRVPGGPPLLGWDDLLEILLKTGRVRYQREQERKAAGGPGGDG